MRKSEERTVPKIWVLYRVASSSIENSAFTSPIPFIPSPAKVSIVGYLNLAIPYSAGIGFKVFEVGHHLGRQSAIIVATLGQVQMESSKFFLLMKSKRSKKWVDSIRQLLIS